MGSPYSDPLWGVINSVAFFVVLFGVAMVLVPSRTCLRYGGALAVGGGAIAIFFAPVIAVGLIPVGGVMYMVGRAMQARVDAKEAAEIEAAARRWRENS